MVYGVSATRPNWKLVFKPRARKDEKRYISTPSHRDPKQRTFCIEHAHANFAGVFCYLYVCTRMICSRYICDHNQIVCRVCVCLSAGRCRLCATQRQPSNIAQPWHGQHRWRPLRCCCSALWPRCAAPAANCSCPTAAESCSGRCRSRAPMCRTPVSWISCTTVTIRWRSSWGESFIFSCTKFLWFLWLITDQKITDILKSCVLSNKFKFCAVRMVKNCICIFKIVLYRYITLEMTSLKRWLSAMSFTLLVKPCS